MNLERVNYLPETTHMVINNLLTKLNYILKYIIN